MPQQLWELFECFCRIGPGVSLTVIRGKYGKDGIWLGLLEVGLAYEVPVNKGRDGRDTLLWIRIALNEN